MSNICPSDIVYWIWLNELRGIPLRTKRTLLALLDSPKHVFSATYDDITEVLVDHCKHLKATANRRHHLDRLAPLWSQRSLKQAETLLSIHEKYRIKTLCATDLPYSHIFTRDANVPLVLYYRGRIAQPEVPITGIIGSRACSSYGRKVTKEAVCQALSRGDIIASGLSFGTDALAHETTLSHQGITYAFLPCGLHRIQPVAHTALCEKIEEHGAVITPFAYGKEALPFRFIERNELFVAWCDTLLVVEARMKSPCMNTARIALSQGKRVLAVPHSLLEPRSEGTNHLLAQGAQVYLNDALLDNPNMHPALDTTHQEQGQEIITVLNDKPLGTGELVSLVGQETSLVMENLAAMEVADQVEYRSDGKWHRVGGP